VKLSWWWSVLVVFQVGLVEISCSILSRNHAGIAVVDGASFVICPSDIIVDGCYSFINRTQWINGINCLIVCASLIDF